MKISGTLDIECAEWDRFAVAATYQAPNDVTIHRSIGSLVDHVLTKRGTWWAHAGGAYDFLAIAEEMRRRHIPCSIDLAGSRISRLVGGGITLRDSWPLIPMSLDVAAALAGERKRELAIPCRCGNRCGGYCQIRPNDPRKEVADYCAHDCRVLYRVLEAIRDIGQTIGLTMRGTIGGTAWATARDTLGLPNADLPPALWRTVREAYYGGRVTIARPIAKGPGSHWDMSSAYPAALATTSVPFGAFEHRADRSALDALAKGKPGVYGCDVHVSERFLPPLPVRQKDRIAYPTGRFHGAWTLHELRAALCRGVTIERVRWSVTWERESVLFADLIERWWRERSRAGKKTPLGQWLRLLSNALPGKFAEGGERRSARMFPDKIRFCEARRPCTRRQCSGACGAWEQLDLWGQAWGVPFYRPAPSAHIQWGAYVTAATRERWLVGAESQGDDLVYGDTDSLWTLSRKAPHPSGAGLGRWEYKHAWKNWECVAPRQYRFTGERGDPELRTAGAKITDEEWRAGEAKQARGVLTFTEAARSMDHNGGLFRRRAHVWTLPRRAIESGLYGDRKLDATTGITLPVPYGET